MTCLIACLTTGKGSWSEVVKIINSEQWDKIFLITNEFGKEKFKHEKAQLITVNDSMSANEMCDAIHTGLKGHTEFNDAAVNLTSGTGKEHMALITAVLRTGAGIRLVTIENDKLAEIPIFKALPDTTSI
jgi:hypothetical protein